MAGDYIRREAVLEAFENANADVYEDYGDGTFDWGFGWKNIQDVINGIPAADAVSVVRCKDCIRRYDTDECPMCFLIEGKYYEYTNGNGFCDRGEPKEGADNG